MAIIEDEKLRREPKSIKKPKQDDNIHSLYFSRYPQYFSLLGHVYECNEGYV